MSARILITWGLGNLGLWITEYLSKQGFQISVLSTRENLEGIQIDKDFELIKADIRDLEKLKKVIPKNIDYIIHLASLNEFFLENYPEKAININSLGTRNLLEAIKDRGIKQFIYFSTFHIYGKSDGSLDEKSELNPKNDYALTHLFAEYYIKQFHSNYKIPYSIFRLTNSYGVPKNKNSSKWYLILNDLSKMAFEKQKIVLKSNGKSLRDFIFMGDVAKVVEKSLSFQKNEIYNLGSGKSISMLEIAKIVQKTYLEIYGTALEIEINKSDKTMAKEFSVDISKLMNIIDIEFKPHFREEIIKIFKLLEV